MVICDLQVVKGFSNSDWPQQHRLLGTEIQREEQAKYCDHSQVHYRPKRKL